MKRHIATLLLTAFLLQGSPAIAGTATLSASGNWSDGTKWTGGIAPNNGNNGDPNWSATVNANTVTVDAAVIIQSLNFGGGTITATNNLTTNAGLTMSGGILTGAGTVTIGGATAWTGGDLKGSSINLNGGLTMSGASMKEVSGGVTNNGAATWSAGIFRIGSSSAGVFNNGSIGNHSASFGNSFDGSVTTNFAGTFNNFGIFTKSGGTGTTTMSAVFNNKDGAAVNVQSGVLSLQGGGTSNGAFTIDAGKTLRITSASYTMSLGTQLLGTGTVETNSAGGTVIFNDSQISHTASFLISAGGLVLNASAILGTSGGLTMSGGSTSGTGALTIGGATAWTGGEFNATTVNLNGGITMSGAATKLVSRTLTNNGAATWSAGGFQIGASAVGVFNNGSISNPTASFTNSFDGSVSTNFAGTFNNFGVFTKSGGTGTTTISSAFSNTGTVNVNTGTLTLSGAITQHSGTTLTGGTWNVTNNSTLTFSSGSNLTTIGSAASVSLDGATSTFNRLGSVTASTLTTNQGSFTLKNARDITTANAFTNSGTLTVQDSTTTFKIGTTGNLAYTQTGPSSVTILAGGAMIDSSAFNLNGGALRGTGTIDSNLTATTANATTIAPGASPGTLTINGSTVLGNSNTLAMEVGGLAAGIDYDLLAVNGILTLGGLLDVDFINGFENSVQFADMFTIVTSTSPILGAFSNVASGSLLATNTTWNFQVWYGAGSPYGADKVVLVSPEPSRVFFLMLGLCSMVMRRRREAGGSMQLSKC